MALIHGWWECKLVQLLWDQFLLTSVRISDFSGIPTFLSKVAFWNNKNRITWARIHWLLIILLVAIVTKVLPDLSGLNTTTLFLLIVKCHIVGLQDFLLTMATSCPRMTVVSFPCFHDPLVVGREWISHWLFKLPCTTQAHGWGLFQTELESAIPPCSWKERRIRTQGSRPDDHCTFWVQTVLGASHMSSVILAPIPQGKGLISIVGVNTDLGRQMKRPRAHWGGVGIQAVWYWNLCAFTAFDILDFPLFPNWTLPVDNNVAS